MPKRVLPPSIKHKNELSPSLDYHFLRKEGIRHVQDLAGKIWTDYNEHDPGVTILEQLCFALTDIAYRTKGELPRVLFSNGDQDQIALNNGFFAPEDILLTSQVTLQDHKMLFLDKLSGIHNIWFGVSAGRELKGLYDIYVQPMVHHGDNKDIEHRVRALFAEYRCISEDIARVVILKPETLEIEMQLELYEDTSVEETIAEMYYQLEAYFNHKVQYCSFEDLRKQGLGYEQIFERPSFDKKRGFLNSLCMEENPTVFSFSKIHTLISKLKGIRSVSELLIRKNGIQVTGDQIRIDEGAFVALSTEINPNYVIVYKNHVRVDYNTEKIKALYLQKVGEDQKMHLFKPSSVSSSEPEHYLDFSNYQSVQNTFPITYGIGTYGLPSEASTERALQARQLQGYLLFFDQILLNHLAQLKHLPELFSFAEDHIQKTYFDRYPGNISNIDELVNPLLEQKLSSLQEDDYNDRKNKCLDHLLARFGEKFVDETLHNLQTIYGLASKEELSSCLVKLKSSFLKQYRLLSQHRNKAYNYYYPTWNGNSLYTGQRSDKDLEYAYPFKKKMFLLMNLPTANEAMVSLLGNDTPFTVTELKEDDLKSFQQQKEENTPLSKVTFVLPNTPHVLEHLTYYGAKKDHYAVLRTDDEQKWKLVFQVLEDPTPMVLGVFRAKFEADQVMAKLITKFKAIHQKSEGFHVVEHLLLRPLLEEQFELIITLETKKAAFLTSIYGNTYEEQKTLLSEVMIYGIKKQHYVPVERLHKELSKKDIASYYVILQDPQGNDLMRLNVEFDAKDLAEAYIEQQLIPFFKKISQEKYAIPSSAQLKPFHKNDGKKDNSKSFSALKPFYDAQMSIVLPNWLPRFNEPDFRALFRKSLCICLPAHMKVNEVWFNKNQMTQFEKDYKRWMTQKAKVLHSTSHPKFTEKDARVKYRNELNQQREDKVQLDEYAQALMSNLLNVEK